MPSGYHHNSFIAIHALANRASWAHPKCMGYHKATVVITEKAHCIHDYMISYLVFMSTLVTSVVLYSLTRATLMSPGQDETCVCGYVRSGFIH